MSEKNLEAWSLQNAVSFYVNERAHAEDLYPSEAAVLRPLVGRITSVLDIGCAVGGFSQIFKELDPRIRYTGVDTSAGMIEQATARHPDASFRLVGTGRLPFDDDAFDLVLCTGVLHHNPDYFEMIEDMIRLSRRFVVVDPPRLVEGPYVFDISHSHMILKDRFPAQSEGLEPAQTRVPYVLANVGDAVEGLLSRFAGRITGMSCVGYHGTVSSAVTIPYQQVIFAMTLLVKGRGALTCHLSLPEDAQRMAEMIARTAGARLVSAVEDVVGPREAS